MSWCGGGLIIVMPGCAAPQRGDVRGHLLARQLAALARLRALGDLDLDLLGPREVLGRNAEARRGDLLDLRVVPLAARHRLVPGRVLAALARVGRAARAPHADRDRLVGLGRQGA